jgi:hypothetical protein
MFHVPPGKLVNVALNPFTVEMAVTVSVGVGGGGAGEGFGEGLGLGGCVGVGVELGGAVAVGVERGALVGRAVGVALGVAATGETTVRVASTWQARFQQRLTTWLPTSRSSGTAIFRVTTPSPSARNAKMCS